MKENTTSTVIFRLDDPQLAQAFNKLNTHLAKGPEYGTFLTHLLEAYNMACHTKKGRESLAIFLAGYYTSMLVDVSLGGLVFCNPNCDCGRCGIARLFSQAEEMEPKPSPSFLAYYEHCLKQDLSDGQRPLSPEEAIQEYNSMSIEQQLTGSTKDVWTYWKKASDKR